MVIKKLGKRLKKAKERREQGQSPQTLIVPRFTTMPVGQRQPGQTPFRPYSAVPGAQKEVYIVEKDVVKPEKKEEKKETKIDINVQGKQGEASIEEEIAKKIRESPFKLRFKTLNIGEMQKSPQSSQNKTRDIRKTFAQ